MGQLWENIRYHTEARGKTIHELANHMGMTLDGLRRSMNRTARLEDIKRIAAWLNVDPCELAFGVTREYVEDRRNAEALRRMAESSSQYAVAFFDELRKRGKLTPLVVQEAARLGLI